MLHAPVAAARSIRNAAGRKVAIISNNVSTESGTGHCIDAAKAHTDGAWHDIKTGVVFAGEPSIDKSGRIVDKMADARYVAAQETSEQFGRSIYLRALLSGIENAKDVVLGDGAEWIWNIAGMHFSGCIEILDYYHACEHIWNLSAVLYGEGSENGKRWAETHCHRLKESGPGSLSEH